MVKNFKISSEEASSRINELWGGKDFLSDEDIRYHEDDEFWANTIYFGGDAKWWISKEGLKPKPLKKVKNK